MSSISATSNSNYLTPLQQLQAELQAEVNSGAISSSDQSALSSALNDINSSLQGGGANSSAATGNTGSASDTSPGDIQSKIDSLIANEVSSGKLTQQSQIRVLVADPASQAVRVASITAMVAMAGTVAHRRRAAPATLPAPVPPNRSCSSSCSHCKARPHQRRPTMPVETPLRSVTAARPPHRS